MSAKITYLVNMKEYYTLKNINIKNSEYHEIAKGSLYEKKSSFISYLYTITNEEEALNYIKLIQSHHKDARHIVYIYSYLQNNQVQIRFSDDGEPRGTGTKAIYELLTKENLTNVCIVIVRYFGGILLGAGPLSRAYLNTAKEAISLCEKEKIYHYIPFEKNISYRYYEMYKSFLDGKREEGIIIMNDISFLDHVSLKFCIREDYYKQICDLLTEI